MRRALAGLLAPVVLGGVGVSWLLLLSSSSDEPASPPPAALPAAVPAVAVAPAPPATPVRLGIPAIDVGTRLVDLGLQDDGSVEVPTNPDRAGWFSLGTVPGDVGSAVLLGHVDSVTGPAVFADLAELARGDAVNVQLSDGRLTHFQVRAVRTYPNADFPARRVYAGHDRPTLTLVTCGGSYDRDRGGYQSNVVVWAELA